MEQEGIEVKEILPADLENMSIRAGSLFYNPSWLALLKQQWNFRFWKTCGPGDEYLVLAQAKGVMGNKLVSLPFSDYTIPHVPPARLPLHIAALQRRFPSMPVIVKCAGIYATPHELRFLGEPVAKACLHRIAIDGDTINRMSATFLRGVRKAQQGGLVAAPSRSEESLQQFYKLYYRLRIDKLGLIPQPLSFFKRVFERFILKGEGFFYEVKQAETIIASAIILREENILYYKWGCSSQEHLHLRPNNLLFNELISQAAATNCQYLDLGLSDLDETRGLIRFKNNMGGEPSFIYTYCQYPAEYPIVVEKQLKKKLNQMADMVVQLKLPPAQTQAFSQSLYPLFV